MRYGQPSHLILSFLAALSIVGCRGGAEPLDTGNVQGVIRVNGKPQPSLRVRFMPDREKGNGKPAFATGFTDQQGKYTLTYEYHNKEAPGAPVGWNRVVLDDTTRKPGQPWTLFPQTYSSPTETPLVYEVKPGDNTIDIDVPKK